MREVIRFISRYGGHIIGAFRDPKTGDISLSRTGGAGVIAVGVDTIAVDPIAGAIIIAAGTALLIFRTRTTEVEPEQGSGH